MCSSRGGQAPLSHFEEASIVSKTLFAEIKAAGLTALVGCAIIMSIISVLMKIGA